MKKCILILEVGLSDFIWVKAKGRSPFEMSDNGPKPKGRPPPLENNSYVYTYVDVIY